MDFVIINIDTFAKLEGWSLYGLVPYRSLFELYFQSFSFTLLIIRDPILLFDLGLYDKLHMLILLLHVKSLGFHGYAALYACHLLRLILLYSKVCALMFEGLILSIVSTHAIASEFDPPAAKLIWYHCVGT